MDWFSSLLIELIVQFVQGFGFSIDLHLDLAFLRV